MEEGMETIDLIKFNVSNGKYKMRFEDPPIIDEVKPAYKVTNIDNSTYTFNTMNDIAKKYGTNISNIFHLISGRKVKGLLFRVEVEEYPYVYTYKGVQYKAKGLNDISLITGRSVSYIHKLIKNYIAK